jgi:hypothetical protein
MCSTLGLVETCKLFLSYVLISCRCCVLQAAIQYPHFAQNSGLCAGLEAAHAAHTHVLVFLMLRTMLRLHSSSMSHVWTLR